MTHVTKTHAILLNTLKKSVIFSLTTQNIMLHIRETSLQFIKYNQYSAQALIIKLIRFRHPVVAYTNLATISPQKMYHITSYQHGITL